MKMQMFTAAAVTLLGAGAAQADYTFVQIDYPGAPSTSVFGINERGEVMGFGNGNDHGVPTSFVYNWRRDEFKDVSPAPGVSTSVLGSNDSGLMVGSVYSAETGDQSAFLRLPDGTYRIFSHPAAYSRTDARAVNGRGLITGFRDRPDGSSVGFIYDPAAESFVDLVPSRFTIAHGINSAGEVVGSAVFEEEGPCPRLEGGRYGWLRDVDGAVTFFQVNGEHTVARGINDAGAIVGSVTEAGTASRKGFIVKLIDSSPCQSLTILAPGLLEFPGYDSTMPEGVTNSGVVVGNVFDNNGESMHGFIATRR